jgi:hypothetical protein
VKKSAFFLPGLICLILFLMACSLAGGGESTQDPSKNLPTPAATTPADPTLPAAATDQPAEPIKGDGDFNLADPGAGLDSLRSYRQSLETTFEGTIGGEETRSQITLAREVVDDPPAELTWIETGEQGMLFFGSVGGIHYSQPSPDETCFAYSQEAASSESGFAYQLAALPPISGATFASEEEINGVQAKRYTFDERAIGFTSPARAQGEVWVASSGGYVLRYVLSLEAPDSQLGPGVSGVQTWSYEVSEVDTGTTSLPESCLLLQENTGPAADLPRMDGAAQVHQQPGYQVYQVQASIEDAVAFYREQAESLGWTAGEPVQFDAATRMILRPQDGSLVQLSFKADGDLLTVKVQTLPPLPAE